MSQGFIEEEGYMDLVPGTISFKISYLQCSLYEQNKVHLTKFM